MCKYIILIIVFLFVVNAFSQNKSKMNYAVQADFVTVIFCNAFSSSFDLDLLKTDDNSCLGTRAGITYYQKGQVDGPVSGSPFTDIDILSRMTVYGSVVEANFCPGITYHNTSGSYKEDDKGLYLKALCEMKLKIFKNYFGLLLKVGLSKESYGGLGIYLGFNSRDSKKK